MYKTTITEAVINIEQLLKKGSFTCPLNVYKAEAEGGPSIKKRTFEWLGWNNLGSVWKPEFSFTSIDK